ncbi:hypothetical protein [Afipia felis]|uniref:Uncharacterized protein n=2 Tax=Afipia felis TaxID=1035 RepID=A0A380WCE2_AFIFE|nr:hypothetical protein [Afipia felis]EKS29876.1 hypothetical protein HMPREF9697_02404 [Afipia felis ATCC 53690]SUU78583.1 Uncharacterised protein [Afipia felis]SUU86648.1 Uncharacterised protein [Afipia felis]
MVDKPFKEKLEEEVENFQEIYEQFDRRLKDLFENEQCTNVWDGSFNAPFDELPGGGAAASSDELDEQDPNFAVLYTIRSLRLHELNFFTALKFQELSPDFAAISDAYELGVIDANDVPQLQRIFRTAAGNPLVQGVKTDRSDAIFWRTLLEIFCRAYVGKVGRPPWGDFEYLQLAIDLNWICHEKLKSWDVSKAREYLNSNKDFRKGYPSSEDRNAVGARRIMQLEEWAKCKFGKNFLSTIIETKQDLVLKHIREMPAKTYFSDDALKQIMGSLRAPREG